MLRSRMAVLALLVLTGLSGRATERLCGTSAETDARLHALHERTRSRIATGLSIVPIA